MDRRKTRQSVILGIFVITVIILILVISRIVARYTPGKEEQDLYEYYQIADEKEAALVWNHEVLDEKAHMIDGRVYLSYENVKKLLNSRFYWDENENLLLYTTASDVITVEAGEKNYFVTKEKKAKDYKIVIADEDTAYIALDYVLDYTDFEYELYENPYRVVVRTSWEKETVATVKKETQLRYRGGIKSPILKQLSKEEQVILLEEGEDWDKVVTMDGLIGYVMSKKLGKSEEVSYQHKDSKQEEFSHNLKEDKVNMVWHQIFSLEENNNIAKVLTQSKGVNVVSPTWFKLQDNQGNITSLADAAYVKYCHNQGVEVWALVTNIEAEGVDEEKVFNYTSNRNHLVNQLIAAAIQYELDGINIDMESLDASVGEGYVQFIRELSLKCKNNGIVLSVDNYVPSDYTAFYNRKEQAVFADYVVIMGYDEHYYGSEEGSVASFGFVKKGLEDTLKEVPKEQVILAAPFYTRVWEETPKSADEMEQVEAASEDYVPYDLDSVAVGMEEGWNRVEANGVEAQWLEEEGQYFAQYDLDGKTYKIWLEDSKSMEKRLKLAKKQQIAGMAFWKSGLEDVSIWDTIIKYMN